MRQENANVKSLQELSLDSLTLSGIKLPMRPGYGNEGKKINLKTNSFRMDVDPTLSIFRYSIDIQPKDLPRRVKRRAFSLLFETPDFQMLGIGLATDFANTIVTTKKLAVNATGRKAYQIMYRELEETFPRPNPKIYQFTATSEGIVPLAGLLDYLRSTTADIKEFPP